MWHGVVWRSVAWYGVVWRGVCFLVLRSLLLLSLVAVERHMIFDYNVNASMAAAAGWQAERRRLPNIICQLVLPLFSARRAT